MDKTTICVTEKYANMRLDKLINEEIRDLSRSHIQKLIENSSIQVNNEIKKANYRVKINDEIRIEFPKPKVLEVQPENIPLDIIYEDKDLIVVNKPQGMVVHPAPGHYEGTLVNALLYHCKDDLSGINGVKRPGIVHRIDRDTSGLLLICKNDRSHLFIAKQLKDHTIRRVYVALVHQNVKNDEGTIDAPIGRHPVHRKKMSINHKNGRAAITHYRVLQRFGQYTLIEARLETGRTHQIRVHMASLGHPLVGDPVYGVHKEKFNLNGQMLHAKSLGFIHPTREEYMEFDSALPDYFQRLFEILKKM